MRRTCLLSMVPLLLFLGVSAWLTWRAVRQVWLDHHLVAAALDYDTPAVCDLLKQGANPNVRVVLSDPISWRQYFLDRLHHQPHQKVERLSALQAALSHNYVVDVPNANPDNTLLVKALLGGGADPNQADEDGTPPLLNALFYYNAPSVTRLLVAYGANVNAKDALRGETALIYASGDANDNISTIKMLLDRGAAVNAQDKEGYTALRQAAFFGRVDVEKLLLRYGADVNAKDAHGETVLSSIEGRNSTDPVSVELLKQAGAKE